MLNNTLYIQDKNYEGIKDNLISLLNTVLDDNKRANIGTIDDLRKTSIAIKAFDTVASSALSGFASIPEILIKLKSCSFVKIMLSVIHSIIQYFLKNTKK